MNPETLCEIKQIFSNIGPLSRDLYRSVKREKIHSILPSERQIIKGFGSFGKFKDMIENANSSKIQEIKPIEEPEYIEELIEEPVEEDDIELEELDPERINEWKEQVKKTRLEIFGEERRPFSFQPESRGGMYRRKA